MGHDQNMIAAINNQLTKQINSEKNWSLPRGYFSIWGHTLEAVLERFK